MTRKMESRRSRLVALGAGLGLLVLADEASAFCRSTTCRSTANEPCQVDDEGCPVSGAPLYWPTSCISYATNKLGTSRFDPADTRAVIRKTFQAWSDVPCPDGTVAAVTFQEREPVSCRKSQYNKTGPNVNVVLFQDQAWRYRGIDGTLAKTSVTYNDETGEIYDADIEINSAFNQYTITDEPTKAITDLQAVLTHEVGHFIGVAHSADPGAVMFAAYATGSLSQRELSPDDVAAVCAAYPANATRACITEPRNGFSASCNDPVAETVCSIRPGAGASYGVTTLLFGSGLLAVRARRSARSARSRSTPCRGVR